MQRRPYVHRSIRGSSLSHEVLIEGDGIGGSGGSEHLLVPAFVSTTVVDFKDAGVLVDARADAEVG